MVENSNRWIADSLASTLASRKLRQDQWPQILAEVMSALNIQPSKATNHIPFYLFFGRPPPQALSTTLPPLSPVQQEAATQALTAAHEDVREIQRLRKSTID